MGLAQGLAHTAFSAYTGRILVSESYHFLAKRTCTALCRLQDQEPSCELATDAPYHTCFARFQAASLFHFPFWSVNVSNSGTPHMSPILMRGFLTYSPFTTTIIIHSLLLWPTSWTDPSAVSVALDCKGSFTTRSDLQNLLGSKLLYLLAKATFLYFQRLKHAACP